MPRGQKKKELPAPVATNGLKDTNVVQKSKPLFSLWKSNLTLSEFKILDTYLSRINSNDPESRSVVFEKGELERLLGVERIRQPELQKRLKHLQGTIVSVGEGKDIDEITLFERSQAVQDEDGLWQIRLTASVSAMKYIFNIEKIGYFRYKIRAITKLRSLYSYTMFMYLEYNKYKGKWTESLDELKNILSCDDELYNEYKYFNQRILHRCQEEIMKNTPLNFTYTPIKKGRKVVTIEFDIKKSQEIEIIDNNPEPKELPVVSAYTDESKFDNVRDVQPQPPEFPQGRLERQPYLYGEFEKDLEPDEIKSLCDVLANKVPVSERKPERLRTLLKSLYSQMLLKSKEPVKKPVSYLLRMINNIDPEKLSSVSEEHIKKRPANRRKIHNDEDFDVDMYKIFINDFTVI